MESNSSGMGFLFKLAVIGGISLCAYQGCRKSQSVTYERDFFGNVTSAKMTQLGYEQTLVPDPKNPNHLIAPKNSLDSVCETIYDWAAWGLDKVCDDPKKPSENYSKNY